MEVTVWDIQMKVTSWDPYDETECADLFSCLSLILSWSNSNPNHSPLFVNFRFPYDFQAEELVALDVMVG